MIHQPRVGRYFMPAHRNHGHRFRASRDDDVGSAAHDSLGCHCDRLKPGRAEAIDRHSGHFDWKPGTQRSDARNVHSLLGLRHSAAEDDVFYFFSIELRHAFESALYGNGGEFVRASSPECALKCASYGSANRGNNHYFTHRTSIINHKRYRSHRRGIPGSVLIQSGVNWGAVMPNRNLNADELQSANELLADIRGRLKNVALRSFCLTAAFGHKNVRLESV